jgi:chorismate synthase
MANTFGCIFRITTFGESHGKAIGGIIDGCPAGVKLNLDAIQEALANRKPGQSVYTSSRKEGDNVELLSGVFDGITLGTPIGFTIPNEDARSDDYTQLKDLYRPSHADYTYEVKYGHRDHRGGGRSSARTTASVVVAGAIAKQFIAQYYTNRILPEVLVYVSQIGEIPSKCTTEKVIQTEIYTNPLRCPDEKAAKQMADLITTIKQQGDSIGGIISGEIRNSEAGLGEPLFNKFQSALAAAMFSINAVHGFEFGSGFQGTQIPGSISNDEFIIQDGQIRTMTNYSGGILGGITNGMPITFRVAFKSTSTIASLQSTINRDREPVELEAGGRHDPCVLPRAVSIVEAFCWIILADMILLNKSAKLDQ